MPGTGPRTTLIATLREALAGRERRELSRPQRAAVLVPLLLADEMPQLLLTRRTDHVATHKGQVAFPGGYAEKEDTSPVETALREAHEEVDLPREQVSIVGLLDDLPARRDDLAVTPVVGAVRNPVTLTPQADEVARIFTVPLDTLSDPARWRSEELHHDGRTWPVFYFDYAGETLWGFSAYVTLQLLELAALNAPFRNPDFSTLAARLPRD